MGLRDQLRTLMWQHGVEQETLLDALDWKFKKIADECDRLREENKMLLHRTGYAATLLGTRKLVRLWPSRWWLVRGRDNRDGRLFVGLARYEKEAGQ